MLEDQRKEFKGTNNRWIKRIGFIFVLGAFFPNLFMKDPVLSWNIIKFVAIMAVASYVMYFVRDILNSLFKS